MVRCPAAKISASLPVVIGPGVNCIPPLPSTFRLFSLSTNSSQRPGMNDARNFTLSMSEKSFTENATAAF